MRKPSGMGDGSLAEVAETIGMLAHADGAILGGNLAYQQLSDNVEQPTGTQTNGLRPEELPVPNRWELVQVVKKKCLDSLALETHFAELSELRRIVRWFAGFGAKEVAVNLSEGNMTLSLERYI